jgi:protein-S-isoprenylcysteine O-methyltransferase Ste14
MSPLVRTLIFTVFIPGFWTVVMPYWMLPKGTRPDTGGPGAVGWLLIAAGVALYFSTAFLGFAVRGKGTPFPLDPPKKLVTDGPYSVVRNPMYWAVVSIIFGEAAIFHSTSLLDLAAVFGLVVSIFVPFAEEPTLRGSFGAEYEEYCRRVPRWFPRFRRRA